MTTRRPGQDTSRSALPDEVTSIDLMQRPANQSFGCGVLPRAVGIVPLAFEGGIGISASLAASVEVAGITHGHPTAGESAGALTCLIAYLFGGFELREAVEMTSNQLAERPHADDVTRALHAALMADARSAEPSLAAHSVLAFALAVALGERDFSSAMRTAAGHAA